MTIAYSHRHLTCSFRLKPVPAAVLLRRNQSIEINITFDPKSDRGRFNDRVELIFKDLILKKRFCITRSLKAIVGVIADYEALRANAPYVRPKKKRHEPIGEIEPGEPPEAIVKFKWAVSLPQYTVPKELANILGDGASLDLVKRIRDTVFPNALNGNTYARFFGILLWIEEERARYAVGSFYRSLNLETHLPWS